MALALILIFVAGYLAIAFETAIKINKAASALIAGVLCWSVYILSVDDKANVSERLSAALGELSGILFFLMGAMAIVEMIDAHNGFEIISRRIRFKNKIQLLWIISFISFFLSPVLDNLTTAIVMTTLLRKLVKEPGERLEYLGMIIIAANAGGAWSPIGDVTTTMLWIGGQVTAVNLIIKLFLPGLVCLVVPLIILSFRLKTKKIPFAKNGVNPQRVAVSSDQYLVFFSGFFVMISVPVFKALTGLPPFMGMLIGLGILWVVTEIINSKKDEEERQVLSVAYALQKIDTPSILFFLGILLSISALEATGILRDTAQLVSSTLKNENVIVGATGLLSAIIDNVPLVAASQGMYSLSQYPSDHHFWIFLAYSTGTGGSLLLIGSAAGVAVSGIERITFFWYLRKITLLALAGFGGGVLVFLLQTYLFG